MAGSKSQALSFGLIRRRLRLHEARRGGKHHLRAPSDEPSGRPVLPVKPVSSSPGSVTGEFVRLLSIKRRGGLTTSASPRAACLNREAAGVLLVDRDEPRQISAWCGPREVVLGPPEISHPFRGTSAR